jgi:predicted AAA+ superfamily ATPase
LGGLAEKIAASSIENPLPEPLHKQCLAQLVRFIAVGGMPEVVAAHAGGAGLRECQQILSDLLLTYYDDFAKYKKRVSASRLREVFLSIMEQAGGKFMYSRASPNTKHESIRTAVDLLVMAGLAHYVPHSSASGIPLAAGVNHKHQKIIAFDTGVMQQALKLDLSTLLLGGTLGQINKGAIAETFVGLEIIKSQPCGRPAQLYYWQREQPGGQAEVDYLVETGAAIIPVEVKAGTSGAMQSLHRFIQEKHAGKGVRTSFENFGRTGKIDICPIYAASRIS